MERDLEKKLSIAVIDTSAREGDLAPLKTFIEEHGDKLTAEELVKVSQMATMVVNSLSEERIEKDSAIVRNDLLIQCLSDLLETSVGR